ncbi:MULTISPECIES: LacI family DNA-binding transcriptional regulator [unclassified Nonomuraea]|uniref:LacI family DNA-binding transcriptional regulator n=1 Tax=unclassified Nonomuraea TaxID=2593643 RepID=UPI0034029A81
MVTLSDVAALAGVSVSTASQALNGNAVKAETRQLVQEAAAKLRYVPRGDARALRTGQATSIALWIINRPGTIVYTEASFFYPLIRGVLAGAQENEHRMTLHVTDQPLDRVGRQLLEESARGSYAAFVIVPQWANDGSYLYELRRTGVPVVMVNDDVAASDASVSINNDTGIEAALAHLVEQGHRAIAYLAGPKGHLDADRRLQAFYRASAELGIHVRSAYVQRGDFTVADGIQGLATLLDRCADSKITFPTALMTANDYVAAGALQEADRRGIAVPRDLSVIGFDDTEIAYATTPPLTTIRQPMFEVGRAAAYAATGLAQSLPVADAVQLEPTLILRGSVATPPQGNR